MTGFARRFAYNAGANDAYITARKLAKYVSRGNSINSSKASGFIKDLERYGITAKDALNIGTKSFKDAVNTSIGKKNLNDAGILAANRDAIIPQVSNRLLFTQSQTPWIRLMGQFMSWAMAKSAQTNRILQRVENGDARTMIKILASIPVYGGIQELRELAKYGEVQTDIDSDSDEWWSEALRLSGMSGVGPEFIASNVIGPGSRQPFFLAFPAGSIAYETDKILKDYFKGNTEQATERFFQRIFPLPNWRNFILERAKDFGIEVDGGINKKLPTNKLEKRQFNQGDVVVPLKKPSEEDMNKKDLAAIAAAATIATGVSVNEMNKAADNKIIPLKKPDVVVEKTYENVSELEPKKKTWLLDTAKKVYTINKDEIIPSDIILAINSGETGWGTSRFFKEGSNNLFNFQSFNDKEESIAAQNSNAKIKKFDTPEASITQFLEWVQTKPSYEVVRKEIKLYNEGKSSKENIIKAIAKTGFAEDKNWSSKITSILNNRIDGKNRKELKSLADNLFKDTDDTKN